MSRNEEIANVRDAIRETGYVPRPLPDHTRVAAARCYIDAMESVHGWLGYTTAIGFLELLWFQEERGVACSGIAEIGIHHGKSFLALAAGAAPGEHLLAIDLFELQEFNLDGSGEGNRKIFLGHLAEFFPKAQAELVTNPSDQLWPRISEIGLSNLRFFSIDGGHTRALTLNDLRLADAALAEDGICALDDVFNTHWTGVISGLADFLRLDTRLVPFAFLPNKLLLCRSGAEADYAAHLRAALPEALEKQRCEFFDWRIDIYGDRPGVLPPRLQVGVEASVAPSGPPQIDESNVTMLHAELEALRCEASRLREEVVALRSSTSWRITAPMRALRRKS